MTSDRKKPGVAFWATMVGVVPALYVASFGPVCWTASRMRGGDLAYAYYPLMEAARYSRTVSRALQSVANWQSPSSGYWDLDKYGRFHWWRLH